MPESPDLHPLFIQLQTRYPTSGLLTELVQIHTDRFVVRAIVQLGSMTLATSLATAATVEQAEDQARLRVLALVGIRPAPFADLPALAELPKMPFSMGTQPPPVAPQPTLEALQDMVLPPAFDRTGQESVPSAARGAAIAPPLSATLPSSFKPPALTNAALPLIAYPSDVAVDAIDAPIDGDAFDAEPSEPESFEPESFEPESFEPESFEPEPPFEPESYAPESYAPEPPTATPEPPSSTDAPAATADQASSKSKPRKPIAGKETPAVETPASASRDLSSLISQIGVEIDRIGWSKRQGSTYLQKTYGKKTRSELTDDELEDFLTYLNTQSAAGEERSEEY